MFILRFLVVAALLLQPALLHAADTNAVPPGKNPDTNRVTTLPEVTITGTRIATTPENTSSSVTVITSDQIARSQQQLVADVLRGEPGIAVARTGAPGAQTGVLLRGSSGDGTLVLVDGIPVNSAFNNTFDFSTLSVNNLERIEILRGPQSALYGSAALGGVINLVTKDAKGPPAGSLQAEYGSFNSLLTRGSFAMGANGLSLAASGSFNSTDNERINSDYQAVNFSGRVGYRFSDYFKVSLLTTYLNSTAGVPNDIYTDDPNDQLKNENYLFGLTLEANPLDWWQAKVILSYTHERAAFDEPAPNPPFFFPDYASSTIAQRGRVDFQNVFTITEQHKILAGGTFTDDSANFQDSFSALDRTIDTRSAYAQYQFLPTPRVTLTAGGRVDDSSAFGTHETYQFGARYTAPGAETIFRANVGTGFLAPSIDDLYFPGFSNPNLQPEEVFGWDAGLEQPLADGKLDLGATFFHNDFDNLIQASGFSLANIGKARTLGVESFASWTPLTNLTFRAAYTWLDSEDLDTGGPLVRRPEHSGSLDINWKITSRLQATARGVFVGTRTDNNFDDPSSPPVVTLPTYSKLDLGLKYDISKNFSIYGRAENLIGQEYQEVYGFPALGRFFAAGITARF